MKDYKKLFSRYWSVSSDDALLCWYCNQSVAVDIHHIESKKMGGVSKNRLNRIDNLFAVCRKCHSLAHKNKSVNEEFKNILQERIKLREKNLI
jgi:5-methylcytosine-specific restriction endonuclease McrA|tara:strand:+ start:126 stop:404 length:279 start_codon:yes stop_codon:yes gene_type:complete